MPDINPICPQVADLKTGDLLFPRPLFPSAVHGTEGVGSLAWGSAALKSLNKPLSASFWEPIGSIRMGDLLKNRLSAEAAGSSAFQNWFATSATNFHKQLALDKTNFELSSKDLSPETLLTLYKILAASEFADILPKWMNMTVSEFSMHPLMTVLTAGLAKDVEAGFFIGHVGMVLREKNGVHSEASDASVFVIEANASDFAHYRVAIHPYEAPDTPDPKTRPEQGWRNFHAGVHGKSVWHRRPRLLAEGAAADVSKIRANLVNQSKKLHGRPYGFFESPDRDNIDRLYCSEFVNLVWEQALKVSGVPNAATHHLSDRQRWKWLFDTRAHMSSEPDFQDLLLHAFNKDFEGADGEPMSLKTDFVDKDKVFFLLTVHMLYWSHQLVQVGTNPGNQEYQTGQP